MKTQQSCLNIMTETTINSILTSISIICTIVSGIAAYRTKKIKEAVHKKLDTIDLIAFAEQFNRDYKKISNKVISKNIGGNTEEGKVIVKNASNMLISLNKILPLLDYHTQEKVNCSKIKIQSEVSKINNSPVPDLFIIISELDSLDAILQKEADKMKKE